MAHPNSSCAIARRMRLIKLRIEPMNKGPIVRIPTIDPSSAKAEHELKGAAALYDAPDKA